MLEKVRPKIIESVNSSNAFYDLVRARQNGNWSDLTKGLTLEKEEIDVTHKYFECKVKGHNKWWKIFPPYKINPVLWGVRVEFGKIGSSGQVRVHAERYESLAWNYYNDKLSEKINKGYQQKASTVSTSAKWEGIQKASKAKLSKVKVVVAPPPCAHSTLTIAGFNKWKCGSCNTVIEFGASVSSAPSMPMEQAAKRFIDLDWDKED